MHEVYHILGFCHDSAVHYDLMDYVAAGGHNINFGIFWYWLKINFKKNKKFIDN